MIYLLHVAVVLSIDVWADLIAKREATFKATSHLFERCLPPEATSHLFERMQTTPGTCTIKSNELTFVALFAVIGLLAT